MNELILLKDLGMKYPTEKSKNKLRYGLYKCYCGEEFETRTVNIKTGHTKSCGCNKGNKKHNLTNHILYKTWSNMMARCNNKNNPKYMYYGLRGIKVCNEWLDINNFIEDMSYNYQDYLTLDRIDVNKDYSKDNCRWVNRAIQTRNTRKLRINNTSGYRGVSWYKKSNKWKSQIKVDNKKINLGYFNDVIEAARAYDNYVILHNLEHTKNFS